MHVLTNVEKPCTLRSSSKQKWGSSIKTISYAQTNIGPVRSNNEDNYYCNGSYKQNAQSPVEELVSAPEGDGLLFGVFDGMGGEARGEDAALICAQTLSAFQSRDMQYEAPAYFAQANAAVCEISRSGGAVSGSTAAVAYFRGNRMFACNVGDSRIYFWRAGELRRLSRDHTKYQQMVDDGFLQPKQDANCSEKHVLTQYLGMNGMLAPHFAVSVRLQPGDRVLLCSDGLTGHLSDVQLAAILGADLSLQLIGRRLVQQALEAGERDNITAVLVEIAALDAETLPDDSAPVQSAQELTQTRRFEVSPEKIAAQREAQRQKQRQELHREILMILLVTLAVLALVGGILYVSLSRPFRNAKPVSTPASEPESSTAPIETMEPVAPMQTVEPFPDIDIQQPFPPGLPEFEITPEMEAELQKSLEQSISNLRKP